MRSSASSNAERAYHPAGGRTPVARTPRRETGGTPATVVTAAGGGHARERALQDPGLKDYVRCPFYIGTISWNPWWNGWLAGRPYKRPPPTLVTRDASPFHVLDQKYHRLIFSCDDQKQRLGDCIGKGAFGSVYKAFNWGTGEAVAVKQIKLGDLPKSELRMIEVNTPPFFFTIVGSERYLQQYKSGV